MLSLKPLSRSDVPIQPALIPSSDTTRLSADIDQQLHKRLKIYAAYSNQSILSVIQGWIHQHCPEITVTSRRRP